MHKTTLTQNSKAKHTSNVKQKHKGERENKWQNHLEPFFFHTLEDPFCLANPWSGGEGEELKLFKNEHEGFEKISKRSKKGWKLILVSQCDHDVALLSF